MFSLIVQPHFFVPNYRIWSRPGDRLHRSSPPRLSLSILPPSAAITSASRTVPSAEPRPRKTLTSQPPSERALGNPGHAAPLPGLLPRMAPTARWRRRALRSPHISAPSWATIKTPRVVSKKATQGGWHRYKRGFFKISKIQKTQNPKSLIFKIKKFLIQIHNVLHWCSGVSTSLFSNMLKINWSCPCFASWYW